MVKVFRCSVFCYRGINFNDPLDLWVQKHALVLTSNTTRREDENSSKSAQKVDTNETRNTISYFSTQRSNF